METELLEWFENSTIEYDFDHKFETLSGWHYFYRSKTKSKILSWEFFDTKFSGLKISYCLMDSNGKPARPPIFLNIDAGTQEGIDSFEEKLIELENIVR